MSYLTNRKIFRYLDGLVSCANVYRYEQFEDKKLLVELLDGHFKKFDKKIFAEYDRKNNFVNRLFKRWNISKRTPLEFKYVNASSDFVYLNFSTDYDGAGFKYLNEGTKFAFLDEGFYVGIGDGKFDIKHQTLFIPTEVISEVNKNPYL